jgi:hypothetical protein
MPAHADLLREPLDAPINQKLQSIDQQVSTMNSTARRVGLLGICMFATACGGLSPAAMTPKMQRSAHSRIDKSIKVGPVTGGGAIDNARITLIAVENEDFSKAERAALEASGIFKAVVQSDPDIELRTTILSQSDERDAGGELTLSVKYDFYETKSGTVVYSDALRASTRTKWASTALETIARNNLDALIYSLPHRWPDSSTKETFRDRVGPAVAGILEGQSIGLFVWHGSALIMVGGVGHEGKRRLLTEEIFDSFSRRFIQQSQQELRVSVTELAQENIVLPSAAKEKKVDTIASAKRQGLDRIFEAIVTPSLVEQGASISRLPSVTATVRVKLSVRQVADGKTLWEQVSEHSSQAHTYPELKDVNELASQAAREALSRFHRSGAVRIRNP